MKTPIHRDRVRLGSFLLLALAWGGVSGCKRDERFSLESSTRWTPEQVAHLLRCEPERSHDTWSAASTQLDSECDMKIEAVLYLQAARHLGRLPGEQDRDAVGVSLQAENLTVESIGPSIQFLDFEIVNVLRGPHVLRVNLSPGHDAAFCCEKVKACTSRETCTCRGDCNGE